MQYRTLGRTGIKVSPYALGAMMFGPSATPTTTTRSASSTERWMQGSTSLTPPTRTPTASQRRSWERRSEAAATIAIAAYCINAAEYAVVQAALARAEADSLAGVN